MGGGLGEGYMFNNSIIKVYNSNNIIYYYYISTLLWILYDDDGSDYWFLRNYGFFGDRDCSGLSDRVSYTLTHAGYRFFFSLL